MQINEEPWTLNRIHFIAHLLRVHVRITVYRMGLRASTIIIHFFLVITVFRWVSMLLHVEKIFNIYTKVSIVRKFCIISSVRKNPIGGFDWTGEWTDDNPYLFLYKNVTQTFENILVPKMFWSRASLTYSKIRKSRKFDIPSVLIYRRIW